MSSQRSEIAFVAARMVVEEGLEYGVAKRRAIKQLRPAGRLPMPDNDEIEVAVREYISLYCAEQQAQELKALRRLALIWMERLTHFRPYVVGAVWQGTATRHSDIYIQLFCDDPKSAEIFLLNQGLAYECRRVTGFRGEEIDALSLHVLCKDFNEYIGVHLMTYDFDDLRGALRSGADGRSSRGDLPALQKLIAQEVIE